MTRIVDRRAEPATSGFTGRWIGVDLDGTLAVYDRHKHGSNVIGPPIPPMVNLVRRWLQQGKDVRIFTSRVARTKEEGLDDVVASIQQWCLVHIGRALPVTCKKDFGLEAIYDDQAVQVITNTGRIVGGLAADLKASLQEYTDDGKDEEAGARTP